MQAPSHAGFAIAGAAITNTVLYRVNPIIPMPYDAIAHVIGAPWTLPHWQLLLRSGAILQQSNLAALLWKLLFYVLLVRFSYAPNRLESSSGGKRGPLHSCCAVVVIGVALIAGYFLLLFRNPYGIGQLFAYPLIQRFVFTAILALLLALAFHILADAITKEGVPAFAPISQGKVGVPLVTATKSSEHAVIYGVIFVVGMLFALGMIGF